MSDRDQKLNIATYFVMSSPVGEVDEVVAGQPKTDRPGGQATTGEVQPPRAMSQQSTVCAGHRCGTLEHCELSARATRVLVLVFCHSEYLTLTRSSLLLCFPPRALPPPSDVKKLVDDDSTLSADALSSILRDYNTEQMTAAPAPGGNGNLLVTKYGQVGSNQYLDPNSGKVYSFNHASRTFGEETDKKQVLAENIEQLRSAVQKSLEGYVTDLYKANKATVVVYGADNGTITICLSAKNVNLSNYW
jgi:hypothetical protein